MNTIKISAESLNQFKQNKDVICISQKEIATNPDKPKYKAIAKEMVDRNGFKKLVYKVNKKIVCYISFPNAFADGFRMHGKGFCYDLHPTIDKPKQSAESFLNRLYCAFGGVEIVYQ